MCSVGRCWLFAHGLVTPSNGRILLAKSVRIGFAGPGRFETEQILHSLVRFAADQLCFGYAILSQVFCGKIDSASFRILFNVAQDVRQLKGYAAFFGQLLCLFLLEAEDVDRGQAYYRSYLVAVAVE